MVLWRLAVSSSLVFKPPSFDRQMVGGKEGRSKYWRRGVFPINGLTPLPCSRVVLETHLCGYNCFACSPFPNRSVENGVRLLTTWWSQTTPEADVTDNFRAALFLVSGSCGLEKAVVVLICTFFAVPAIMAGKKVYFVALTYASITSFLLTLRWISSTKNYTRGIALLLSWRTVALHQRP